MFNIPRRTFQHETNINKIMASLTLSETTMHTKSSKNNHKNYIDSNNHNNKTINISYCNQMHANYKHDQSALKRISHH